MAGPAMLSVFSCAMTIFERGISTYYLLHSLPLSRRVSITVVLLYLLQGRFFPLQWRWFRGGRGFRWGGSDSLAIQLSVHFKKKRPCDLRICLTKKEIPDHFLKTLQAGLQARYSDIDFDHLSYKLTFMTGVERRIFSASF